MADNYGNDPLFNRPGNRDFLEWLRSIMPPAISENDPNEGILPPNLRQLGLGSRSDWLTRQTAGGPAYPPPNIMPRPPYPGPPESGFPFQSPPQQFNWPQSSSYPTTGFSSGALAQAPPNAPDVNARPVASPAVPPNTPPLPPVRPKGPVATAAPAVKPRIDPAQVDLGYYQPGVGNARTPVFVPQGQTAAPAIFRGPLAMPTGRDQPY